MPKRLKDFITRADTLAFFTRVRKPITRTVYEALIHYFTLAANEDLSQTIAFCHHCMQNVLPRRVWIS